MLVLLNHMKALTEAFVFVCVFVFLFGMGSHSALLMVLSVFLAGACLIERPDWEDKIIQILDDREQEEELERQLAEEEAAEEAEAP